MAPSTRRRKPKQQEEVIPESIFDALNAHNPGQEAGRETTREEAEKPKGPSVEDLMKQIEEMNRRVDAAERANMALTTAAPSVTTTQQEPKLNMDGLPDPLDKPKEYGEALAKRVADFNAETQRFYREQERQRQAAAPDFDGLWREFSTTNEAYLEDQEGLEFIVNKVKKDAERKGLDLNRYMFQNSDRFFRDITTAYDKRFGKPGEDEENLEDTRTTRRKAAEPEGEEEANRTGGIFGGIDGSSGGRKPASAPAGDLIKDLQDIQRKSGYF